MPNSCGRPQGGGGQAHVDREDQKPDFFGQS